MRDCREGREGEIVFSHLRPGACNRAEKLFSFPACGLYLEVLHQVYLELHTSWRTFAQYSLTVNPSRFLVFSFSRLVVFDLIGCARPSRVQRHFHFECFAGEGRWPVWNLGEVGKPQSRRNRAVPTLATSEWVNMGFARFEARAVYVDGSESGKGDVVRVHGVLWMNYFYGRTPFLVVNA